MIAIILAMTKDRVIGKDGTLPWNIPEEMAHFRRTTTGATVIMGRATFDSIGKPMPKRHNIVLSRSSPDIYGVDVCRDVEEALEKAQEYGKDIYIIGGATIVKQMMRFADTMILSIIKKKYPGDTYFPRYNEDEWELTATEKHTDFDILTYTRKPTASLDQR